MKIGIYGGSFNPIHRGHIALARQIRRILRLNEVWFMVSPLNPLKKDNTDLLDDEIRLNLTRKALEKEEGLVACDYEFHLPRPSYTWDTLQALSKDYPEHKFTLIIGADNWAVFDRWYRADDILNNYHVAIYPRKGSPVDFEKLPPSVTLMETRYYRHSSTEIRRRLREGKTVRQLVPVAIYNDLLASPLNPVQKVRGESSRHLYSRHSGGVGGGSS